MDTNLYPSIDIKNTDWKKRKLLTFCNCPRRCFDWINSTFQIGQYTEAFGANILHLCKKWAQSRNNSTRSSTIRRFFSGGVQQSKIFERFSKLSKTNIFIFSEQCKCGCQNWYDDDKILDSTIKSCIITGTACHYILPVVGDRNYKYRNVVAIFFFYGEFSFTLGLKGQKCWWLRYYQYG